MRTSVPTFALVLTLLLAGCASAGAVESSNDPEPEDESETQTAFPAVTTDAATLDDALATANELASDLQAYEEQRAQTTARVDEATSQALSVLENGPSSEEMRQATRTWRENWNAVQEEVNALAMRYAEASATAVGYFHHLDAQTATISNEELRTEEQERNDEIHASWRTTSGDALQALRIIRANLKAGDDLHVTMLNASLRSGFDVHVDRLRTVGNEMKEALDALEAVTNEGETLVGQTGNDTESTTANASEGRDDS